MVADVQKTMEDAAGLSSCFSFAPAVVTAVVSQAASVAAVETMAAALLSGF